MEKTVDITKIEEAEQRLKKILSSSNHDLASLIAITETAENISDILISSVEFVAKTTIPPGDKATVDVKDIKTVKKIAAEIRVLYQALNGITKSAGKNFDELERIDWELKQGLTEEN